MSVYRDILFTKVDEAALSAVIREKYPNVQFFEDRDWYIDSTPPNIPSIDVATTRNVFFIMPEPDWRPTLELYSRDNTYWISNFPELLGFVERSGGVWGSENLTEDGEPRIIMEGSITIMYKPPATKAQASFKGVIWRLFDKVGTWRLAPFGKTTRRRLDWEKTDKRLWAGNDAIRWANENTLRSFPGDDEVIFKPIG